jgi:restriction system protein
LEDLQRLSPKAFERYVASLFKSKGYRVGIRGGSGDLGVDLELAGMRGRRAIVQCKRYQNTIGAEIIRELYGTLIHEGVHWAFLVTTAEISDAARQWAEGKPITLIDGAMLLDVAHALGQGKDRLLDAPG